MKKIFKSIAKYFRGVKKELERIKWTSRKDLFKYSLTTIVFIIFCSLYFYLIDLCVAVLRSL